MRAQRGTVVLLAPYDVYAQQMIRRFHRHHGLATIAVHRNWPERQAHEAQAPALHGPAIAAHYMLPRGGWPELTRILRARGDVVAVAPHHEMTVAPLAQLATDLQLDWAQPEVLPHFRDKASLKALVRRNDPDVRLNFAQFCDTPEVALATIAEHQIPRVVLKPNDGGGGAGVGFFAADDEPGIRDHFARAGRGLLLEEYVGGREYYVNGQTDEAGHVTVFVAGEEVRCQANDHENVYLRNEVLPTHDPRWPLLAHYAERVVEATGLRRSPFHMEVKLDERGPCLIEVGARLVGFGIARADSRQHGTALDTVDIAAHHYASAEPYGPYPLNWDTYNSLHTRLVFGIATDTQRVLRVSGVREVEQMPEFAFWLLRPRIGKLQQPTIDVETTAYGVGLFASSQEAIVAADSRARELIRWNDFDSTGARVAARVRTLLARASRYGNAVPRPYQLRAALRARLESRSVLSASE